MSLRLLSVILDHRRVPIRYQVQDKESRVSFFLSPQGSVVTSEGEEGALKKAKEVVLEATKKKVPTSEHFYKFKRV